MLPVTGTSSNRIELRAIGKCSISWTSVDVSVFKNSILNSSMELFWFPRKATSPRQSGPSNAHVSLFEPFNDIMVANHAKFVQ